MSASTTAMAMALAILTWARTAPAQGASDGGNPAAATLAPTMAQFNKLQNEVREQRQLIVQMLQAEQQRYEMLLKLIRVQGSAAAPLPDPLRLTTPSSPAAGLVPDAAPGLAIGPAAPDALSSHARGDGPAAERGRKNGTISGHVTMTGGDADFSDVYVFIENVKGAPVRGKTVEIKQENKQFSPRAVVVQAGTSVVFPNLDSVYHNVFSTSPHNSFDLGTSRSGDTPRAVTLTKPGVVEVFCNMHQKMSANILVVPGPWYAKTHADGSFRIDNVPLGTRKVVAWSPRTQSSEQRIELTSVGAQITFALKADERKAHPNKVGQAYGSYRD